MPLDSDVQNADSFLHVEFYEQKDGLHAGETFIRIMVPGDKTNVIEQRLADHHKERFPRQWTYYQMANAKDLEEIGVPLDRWRHDEPEQLTDAQMIELHILKFQTVEQVATASDSQLQRIGMGAVGLRNRARSYLEHKNKYEQNEELYNTRKELEILKAQMAEFFESQAKKPGRPKKDAVDVEYDAPTGAASNE
jgi:hypothetical protein